MQLKNKRKPYLIFLVISVIFTVLFLFDWFFDNWDLRFQFPIILQTPIKVEKRADFISPLVVEAVEAKSSVQLADSIASTPQPKGLIEQEIYEVFGEEYFGEAMELLECENPSLNPKAVNINKDGSKDYGIFQLNSFWHGFNKFVNNKRYLFDPAINIRIAYRLFVTSGNSFKLWSCYKK